MVTRRNQSILESALYLLFAVIVVGFATLPVAAAPALSGADINRIDAYVSRQMQRHKLPGLALALVEGDQVVFMKGYGKADQSGRPITPQTPFLLASVSKPLTAAAIMQLVEAGRVELDAPVQRYVPNFRMADPAASAQITVRHLLLHTSGIPVTSCDTRVNAQTLTEFVAELRTVTPAAPPGTLHSYCSGNYNVLGRIIEVVSGQPFGSYMQEHVFTPLGMVHSFTIEQDARQAGMAQGYQWFFGLPVMTRQPYNPSQLPSGFMISSAEDMTHFLISQLNGGRYAGTSFLSGASVAAMQMPGVKRSENSGYGLGWVVGPFGGKPAVWHDGAGANFRTLMLMLPETHSGVVILMNAFGILASEGAEKEIQEGVVRLLGGLEPAPEASLSLGAQYLVIDLVLAALLAFALWPLLRLRRWELWLLERQQAGRLPLARVILRAALEILLALGFLVAVRVIVVSALGGQSWGEVLAVFPDFVLWIWTIALIVLATGAARMALIWKARRAV